jgi:hypothetical protein
LDIKLSTAIANAFDIDWLRGWEKSELTELIGFIHKAQADGEVEVDDPGVALVIDNATRLIDRHQRIAAAVSRFDDDGNLLDPTGNEDPWNRSGY